MNQPESTRNIIKEQVPNPEIEEAVNVNQLVIIRDILESQPIRNINQYISDSGMKVKEVAIVAIIVMMVIYINRRW